MRGPVAAFKSVVPEAFRATLLAILLVFVGSGCATVKNAAVGAAERATGREVAERVDRGVSTAANGAEDAVSGGNEGEASSGGGNGASPAGNQGGAAPLTESSNYDFESGERVLFATDFASDNMGDFPKSLDWKRGTIEVVELGGNRFLRAGSSNAAFSIPLPEALPEQFTIEVDIYNPSSPYGLIMSTGRVPRSGAGSHGGEPSIQWAAPAKLGHGLIGSDGSRLAVQQSTLDGVRGYEKGPVTARVMMDGEHLKLYWGTNRIANVPHVEMPRGEFVHLVLEAGPEQPIYVGNIRVAAGGRDLYAVLEREGRFTADGIEFDTGSDRIRPTSRATLDEIGAMLREHTDLELEIEGHTDSQGSDATNQDLSGRRAASVRTYLIENYGIDAGRLSSVGYGEARPVASNDTPEGRQANRRVELVRAGAERSSTGQSDPSASRSADAGSSATRITLADHERVGAASSERGEITTVLRGEERTLGVRRACWSTGAPPGGYENGPDFGNIYIRAGAPSAEDGATSSVTVHFYRSTREVIRGYNNLTESRVNGDRPADMDLASASKLKFTISELSLQEEGTLVRGTFDAPDIGATGTFWAHGTECPRGSR